MEAGARKRALGRGDHDGAECVIAGVTPGNVVRAAHVRVHGLLGQVREGARPEPKLVERAAKNGDDPFVVSPLAALAFKLCAVGYTGLETG